MRHQLAIALIAALAPATAGAEQPVSPSEFREFAEGWTLFFERQGQPYGSETFEPDGKVRWRYEDGTCVDGDWRPHGAQVCFLYTVNGVKGEILCWRVLRTDGGALIARLLTGSEAGLELTITRREKTTPACNAPGAKT